MGVCSNATAAPVTAMLDRRSKSSIPAVPRKSRNCWHFISTEAMRSKSDRLRYFGGGKSTASLG